MEIREYKEYKADDIRCLYTEVGWTAYTENMSVLEQGYKHSLLVLAAYLPTNGRTPHIAPKKV